MICDGCPTSFPAEVFVFARGKCAYTTALAPPTTKRPDYERATRPPSPTLSRSAQVWKPGNCAASLCSKLLHNSLARPRVGERAHVFEIPRREYLHPREHSSEIGGQSIDHLRSPAESGFSIEDVATDAPGEQHELAIDGEARTKTSLFDSHLESGEQLAVSVDGRRQRTRHRRNSSFASSNQREPAARSVTCEDEGVRVICKIDIRPNAVCRHLDRCRQRMANDG